MKNFLNCSFVRTLAEGSAGLFDLFGQRAPVVSAVQQIRRLRLGALPDPASLRVYAELIPDGAERITRMAETESVHRQAEEARLVACETRRITRGQWMAFVLTLLLASAALYLGITDHDWLAAGLFTTTIGAVVTIFVLGHRERASSLRKSEPSIGHVTGPCYDGAAIDHDRSR